jgi:hypothetical protein
MCLAWVSGFYDRNIAGTVHVYLALDEWVDLALPSRIKKREKLVSGGEIAVGLSGIEVLAFSIHRLPVQSSNPATRNWMAY